jgi:SAM-dependent methyltransferase
MTEFSQTLISRSGYDRPGFAAGYDRFRPRPPRALLDTLLQVAGVERALRVVDLGAGTGLSTRAWAGDADEVVGVEPNPAMREQAEALTAEPSVRFVHGFAQETGLDGGGADLVTCSQSLHWMDPGPTFAEAARLLRPGGVFAAYDYDLPPTCAWEAEVAWDAYIHRRTIARDRRGIQIGADRWAKSGHLERLKASGRFRFCREVVLQSVEPGSADRLVGLARSLGLPAADVANEELERELGIPELESAARAALGDAEVPFRFGYRVRFGVL